MLHYIIDGNNLIGKNSNLFRMKDRQLAREKLVFIVDNYFSTRKVKVTICLDGFKNAAISTNHSKIIYSENKTADDIIKHIIESEKNPFNVTVVTSDRNLAQFASVCRCKVISSEEFSKNIKRQPGSAEEENLIKSISKDEIKKLFGEDEKG